MGALLGVHSAGEEGLLQLLLAAGGTGLLTAWLVLVQPPLWITVIGTLTSLALTGGPFQRIRSLHPRD